MTAPIPGAPAPTPAPAPAPTPAPPAPQPPAPAPQPQPVNPIPAPTQPGQQPTAPPVVPQPGLNGGQGEPGATGPGITFPAHTPWRDMSPEHQVAYWQHQARKHEQRASAMPDYEQAKADQARYQELLQTTQSEHDRAIAEARRQGEAEATQRANSALVEAYFRAAGAARGAADEDVSELLADIDRSRFINGQSGQVDTARIYALVNRLAPVPGGAPAGHVPAAVPAPPAPVAQVPPAGWPATPPAGPSAWPQTAAPVPGQPGAPAYPAGYPTAPAGWPGQVPAAPAAVAVPQMPPGAAPAAPVPGQVPDMGQGQFLQAPASGLEAGRAAARARHARTQSTPAA
jgi:hypothetical protein